MNPPPQSWIKDCARLVRRRCDELLGRELRLPLADHRAVRRLGSEYCNWALDPSSLGPESVIYSFGLGTDVTFELELLSLTGAMIHAFDPTPRAAAWIRSQPLPERFAFHELGLYDQDTEATFQAPEGPFVSYSLTTSPAQGTEIVRAPVRRLSTIARDLGHSQIDLVKMDIEGAEFAVIGDLVSAGPHPRQLLVEMHYRKGCRADLDRVAHAVDALAGLGYRLFHRSPWGPELSFILDSRR